MKVKLSRRQNYLLRQEAKQNVANIDIQIQPEGIKVSRKKNRKGKRIYKTQIKTPRINVPKIKRLTIPKGPKLKPRNFYNELNRHNKGFYRSIKRYVKDLDKYIEQSGWDADTFLNTFYSLNQDVRSYFYREETDDDDIYANEYEDYLRSDEEVKAGLLKAINSMIK